ncbi:MAG: DUF3298 domain-containing protein [Bacteroidetes bacterium]|nr:DUF3298 domain-containing protein [Bacteroidota bacterium]
MDKHYEDIATVHMTYKEDNIYNLEYTDVKNKSITVQAIELTSSNTGRIYIQNYLAQDCKRADSMRKINQEVISNWDTVCDIVNVFWPKYMQGGKGLESMQKLVYDAGVLNNYFRNEENGYLDIYENNFPIEFSTKYLCLEQKGYVFTGGAHGMPGSSYTTIDLSTQKIVKVYDVIDTTRKQELVKIAEPFFVKQNGPLTDWQFEKGFYTPKNIGILSDGLIFQYDAYEIGAYAQGMPSFFVPYLSLATIMK